MNKLMTTTTTDPIADPFDRDAAFFQIVEDIDLGVDAWNRRAVRWSRFADRLRAHGATITIGGPF